MPSQSASETSSSTKRSGEGESAAATSHEYTLCLIGDWAHLKAAKVKPLSPKADSPSGPLAVHEIAADFDSAIVHVSCGSGWGALLCEDGRAYSFGSNTYGQLGQGHDRHVTAPVPMSAPFCLQPRRRIMRLSCGSTHGGFVLDVGELYMFGCGSYGRLGTGNDSNTSVPAMVRMKWSTLLAAALGPVNHRKQHNTVVADEDEDEVRFTDVSCGDRHTLALAVRSTRGDSDSRRPTTKPKTSIVSFGDGMNGRLGLGDEKDRHEGALLSTWLAASNVPGVGIAGNNGCMTPPTISAICAGPTHNLALSASGDVFSWGNGVDGQLGHGTNVSEWVPRQLAFFKSLSVTSVSCGASHSVAVSRTGVVYTWGRGAEGQLGLDLEGDATVDVVDKCVCVPHPVGILKGSTQRVTVRSIVAKRNVSLAVDDRDRVFVWGDNALEQLGLSQSANTNQGTRACIPKPRMLAYMDLRAPKPASCSSTLTLSRVASLRELVAAAKPDPIRLGLAHIDAGDRFTMLVFTTKPGISSSSNTAGGEARESHARLSPEASPDTKVANAALAKWGFSATDELPMSAIPSREPAYYQFMVNYKVHVRPTVSKSRDDEEEEREDEIDRDMQRRSPRRRELRRSTVEQGGRVRLGAGAASPSPGKQLQNAKYDEIDEDAGASSSPPRVNGFDSWLGKRLNSPSKSWMAGPSFANTPRFPSPSKEEETRSACSSHANDTPRARGALRLPVKPQKPRRGFGRTLSARRPTALVIDPPGKKTPVRSSPPEPASNQELSPRPSPTRDIPYVVVPFGSSVESRFGPSPAKSSADTPIYPEKCALRDRRAPLFTMGGAEHFSLVISRRLHHAKGPGPGPGTYDRHGG
jgi:alpha-tubulin suppressor-like RCC1 family protein